MPHRGKPNKALRKFLQKISRTANRQVNNILRRLIVPRRRLRGLFSRSGYVMPLVIVLLVAMAIVVSSITFRSAQRSIEVSQNRQQQVIANAASPAIDRAKTKLEFLFGGGEDKWPGAGLPSESDLAGFMDDDGKYTLPDETRIDLNGDGTKDNAWMFEVDIDGDSEKEKIGYSILTLTEKDGVTRNMADSQKAKKLVVRNGPINLVSTGESAGSGCNFSANNQDQGWDVIVGGSLRRAFQVNAVVIKDKNGKRNVTTLEMQQDRQADRNKWGAWLRNDLEVFPGPGFNWNGAMHTEGSLIIGDSSNFRAYLVSSPFSCLYTRENGELTINEQLDEDGNITFQGQMLAGSMKTNTFAGASTVDLYGATGPIGTVTINSANDSVNQGSKTPQDFSLDPVVLYTTNENKARGTDKTNSLSRINTWDTSDQVKNGRIFNKYSKKPYVDDSYRADDRYGPNPTYSSPKKQDINLVDINKELGDPINASDTHYAELTNNTPVDPDNPEDMGIDGFWERRARYDGMRVIVGQRLELGNTYGWEGNIDPLYPPNDFSITHERKQWRSLRDNLAAVQGTAIYHHTFGDGYFPIACMATTAHPGTRTNQGYDGGTVGESTRFTDLPSGLVETDFLSGVGTNGWEFNPPATTESGFSSLMSWTESPMRRALTNLAHFAGDPDGAFPPTQETSGTQVHPDPDVTMWGNFSELRRVMDRLDSGVSYSNLSIADKSTLHSAACTLGMLAYNLKNQVEEDKAAAGFPVLNETEQEALKLQVKTNIAGIVALGEELHKMVDNYSSSNPPNSNIVSILKTLPTGDPNKYTGSNPPKTYSDSNQSQYRQFYDQFTAEKYLAALNKANAGIPSKMALVTQLQTAKTGIETLRSQGGYSQIERDRKYGFAPSEASESIEDMLYDGTTPLPLGGDKYTWNPTTKVVTWYNTNNDKNSDQNRKGQVTTTCNPEVFGQFISGGGGGLDEKKIGLALAFCNPNVDDDAVALEPKYPSLYYLFPKEDHDRLTGQPNTEPYISQNDNDGGYEYTVLDDKKQGSAGQGNGVEDSIEDSLAAIAIQPRKINEWKTPISTTSAFADINRIRYNNSNRFVAFQDHGIFNGREQMSVRTLDLDLDLLRNAAINGDYWLPLSGIVYAFREDAVRENAIARPRGTSFVNCDTAGEITSSSCRMNAVSATPKDPPQNELNISPKAVDFYPDPDRRPHGFRLRKGKDLRRGTGNMKGLSFITDQPVYIMADDSVFNLHAKANACNTSNLIQEFTQILDSDWGNFYSRKTLNSAFAREGDCWRPAEIIADAVTILSGNFVDGTIAEGMTNSNVGNTSSYRNINYPSNNENWVREKKEEDPTSPNYGKYVASNSSSNESPVKISRNGYPYYCTSVVGGYCAPGNLAEYKGTYRKFNEGKTLISPPSDTRINATLISGLIPSRGQQSYGGFHNFPRFLENWSGKRLWISGAFIQLKFSSYATGPFDQDSWEPGNTAQGNELITYYGAPDRRWGYDVGIQYAPAGPVAARLVTPSKTRSEFYRELPINDPYICNLRKVVDPGDKSDCP